MADPDLVPTDKQNVSPGPSQQRGGRWIVVAVGLAALAVGGVAAAVIANQEDSTSYVTAQTGWVHEGCQRWADSRQGANAPDDGWCSSMRDWMNSRIDQRWGGMTMRQDPASVRATCREWIADNPSAGGPNSVEWCDEMVSWISGHMSDWDQWMPNGTWMGE